MRTTLIECISRALVWRDMCEDVSIHVEYADAFVEMIDSCNPALSLKGIVVQLNKQKQNFISN